MSLYIPSYLQTIACESNGWPRGLDAEGKQELRNLVSEYLNNVTKPMPLYLIVDAVKAKNPKCFEKILLQDYYSACIHRTLLDLRCEQVWSLPK